MHLDRTSGHQAGKQQVDRWPKGKNLVKVFFSSFTLLHCSSLCKFVFGVFMKKKYLRHGTGLDHASFNSMIQYLFKFGTMIRNCLAEENSKRFSTIVIPDNWRNAA